jgi:uncharacterized protein YlxW (UPF0749 family)
MLKRKMLLSFVSLLAGLMVAVLFQSNQEPEARDTRDLWEIRTDLRSEQIRQQNLYQSIREAEAIIGEYDRETNEEKIETLKETIRELKDKVGLTETKGRGLVISVKPIYQDLQFGQVYPTIPPDLINRLINELNVYGATDIAIVNERIVTLSPIRSVGEYTYVNNRPIPPLPIEIKVLAKDVEKLLDYMQVSKVNDYFVVENLELTYDIQSNLVLPSYDQQIDFKWLESETEETGD